MPTVAPYGSWDSTFSPRALVEEVVRLAYPLVTKAATYWVEQRPAEGGRQVVVRLRRSDGAEAQDLFGVGFNARTSVHEYGGRPYTVAGDAVYFSNHADQRLYRVTPESEPVPITPAPNAPRAVRFAAPVATPDGRHLFAVRERHRVPDMATGVENDVVVVPTDGSVEPRPVVSARDFFSHVNVSPDGSRLCWVAWDHPRMPWDGTELWEAEIGANLSLSQPRLVAGGPEESVTQPSYLPDGRLLFVSDRTGWWNLYATEPAGGDPRLLGRMSADLAGPDWALGMSSYAVLGDGAIVATWFDEGYGRLGILTPGLSRFEEIITPFTGFSHLRAGADGRSVVMVAGSSTAPPALVRVIPRRGDGDHDAGVDTLASSVRRPPDPAQLSAAEPIEFPTSGGTRAHALYYPPHNPAFEPPPGERPPLIVRCHGGPTGAVSPVLDYGVQFWTSRGFAVVDVDYGGSSGHGRAYRERLRGQWGIVDVEDCVHAARFLAATDRADPDRLVIRGASAGGYTTLCALTFHDVFAAGADCWGVADVEALSAESHKFELHYNDSLIGPWPEASETYRARSPVHHATRLQTPVIVFQGLDDPIVPPSQSRSIVDALRRNGVPHAYVEYAEEGHGLRKGDNVQHAAAAELYFYGRVLGFTPCGAAPVDVAHAERLGELGPRGSRPGPS